MTRTDLDPKAAAPRRNPRPAMLALAGAAVALALTAGIVPRWQGHAVLQQRAQAAQTPIVSVVQPRAAAAAHDIILPADVRAYEDAAIHARVNGYLRHWYADIGTPVKAGQLLAEIDAPEVADQLRQARADEATAAANYQLASTTAKRWQDLQATNAVAQQETDQKVADMNAKAALLAAARSNTSRLAQLASYTQIRAPFDGVITARNVDTGALIDAGSAPGQGRELFHISAGTRLRVYAQVPQDVSAAMGPGTQAWLTLPQAPDKRYPATVARTAGAIDPVTRSLRVELDVDSQDGRILPGAYAQVHLEVGAEHAGLDLPANTLMFPAGGPTVAVVGPDNTLTIRHVALGRDFGTHVEVLDGLQASDRVVVNPGDGIVAGMTVRVAAPAKRDPA
ncbi:efflux RND transporter periplasmic adaptor subunit [Cupriavidus sp. CER94]|uniref:efflux RND transporter periplasmic adaptor subunit n=1 Tax=Cupriavidus sp. CER94 TaxID=3377036 RepID=UPI003820865F